MNIAGRKVPVTMAVLIVLVLLLLIFTLIIGKDYESKDGEGTIIEERAAMLLSPELKRVDERTSEINTELSELPELLKAPFGSRYGFRSIALESQDQPDWLQVDFETFVSIDQIAIVPIYIPGIGQSGVGYGFPKRFKIEAADNPDMDNAITLVDHTQSDIQNPGRFPLIYRIEPTRTRYVRFTSTKHPLINDDYSWGLEELLLLSGNKCVSATSAISAPNSLQLFPNWAVERAVDGQSALGMPVNITPSPSRGYTCETSNNRHADKWIIVDLGQPYKLDEIRLMPIESGSFEVPGWQSFPRAWTLSISLDESFENEKVIRNQATNNWPGFPGRGQLFVRLTGDEARYIKLTANDLWSLEQEHGFGMSEIQVYSGNENVALNKDVIVKDTADNLQSPELWSKDYLVDGYNSRFKLIEFPEYLTLIETRGELTSELTQLSLERYQLIKGTGRVLTYGGSILILLAIAAFAWLIAREKANRREAVTRLRNQIARDLHDDIGSNLGGIVLLSDMGSRNTSEDQSREDFTLIKEAAEGTAQSMQDIVWLIGHGSTTLKDLISRMKRSAEALIGEDSVSLVVDPEDYKDQNLSLFCLRHIFFAYKETLNNIRRHADASHVDIRINIRHDSLIFEVTDNGSGFNLYETSESGHGLSNLKRRAGRVRGECIITSNPGKGTKVTFKALFNAPEL